MKLFSLLFQGDVHLSSPKKVLPQEAFSQILTAKEIIEKAKEDAKRYQEQTQKECEKLKEQAKEDGFKQGLESFNAQLIHFDKQLHELRLNLQKQILPLVLKAAKKVVANQLELKPDIIVDIVIQALTPVLQNHRFTIYVNKEDKETLDTNRPRIREILEHVQTLIIQERADISPGGCIIETESGIINATIENQWSALENAFKKYTETT